MGSMTGTKGEAKLWPKLWGLSLMGCLGSIQRVLLGGSRHGVAEIDSGKENGD